MIRLIGRAGLLCLCALAGSAAGQEVSASVYKWVDAQGVTHYSDQPPPGSNAEEMATIRYRKAAGSASAPAKAKGKADAGEAQGQGADKGGDAVEPGEGSASEKDKLLAQRQANCKEARERVSKYDSAQRLYRPGPNGEREYLTDEELDTERANARRAVEQYCD